MSRSVFGPKQTFEEKTGLVDRTTPIADLMREWRRRAGLNTTAAGERLGLSRRTIEDIEQGRSRADDELTRIALLKLIGESSS